ncbi:putative synaptobrevin [Trypanosoma cruzi]|nr:putative synaptobrevin [Trypanosoma cruzi]
MEQLVKKIWPWIPKGSITSIDRNTLKSERPTFTCNDETINYATYHLCAYDPILGNLLCVGDNVPVVVLTCGRRRAVLPVRKGLRWLDVHIFAGTSSFLLLSPECLLLVDFTRRHSPSALFSSCKAGALFACLHVPQGMTWGVVGCRGGSVMYWKLKEEAGSVSLFWAAMAADPLEFCRPFLPTPMPPSCGHIYSIDSNPTSPNILVAVLSEVDGVCKWHMDENCLSGFYRMPNLNTSMSLKACRMTPGGVYIVAITSDTSTLFIWSDGGKKTKNKSVEVFWTLKTGCRLPFSPGNSGREEVNESEIEDAPCGIHIARSAGSSSQAQSDKKCQMHLLLHSAGELVELVLDVEGRQLLQREDLLAHVTAVKLEPPPALDVKDALAVNCVVPCSRSKYWKGMWTEGDLDVLLLTTRTYGPLLIRRCRLKRNVESIDKLEEVPRGADPSIGMLLLYPPLETLNAIWSSVRNDKSGSNHWQDVLHGMEFTKHCNVEEWDGTLLVLGVFSDVPTVGVCLLPLSNECIPIPTAVMEQHTAWLSYFPSRNDRQLVILEQAIPEPPRKTEMILRVVVDEDAVFVFVTHLSLGIVEPLLKLSRECLMPDKAPGGRGDDDDEEEEGPLARAAVLINCRIENSGDAASRFRLLCGGYSILLQLRDASLVLVSLSGEKTGEEGFPLMVRYPSALFPAHSTVASFDTVWIDFRGSSIDAKLGETNGTCLALLCALSDQKGVVVWDMSQMRILSYYPNNGCDEWRCKTVIACPQKDYFSEVLAGVMCEIVVMSTTSSGTVATHGSEGFVYLRDVFGRLLLSLRIRYAPNGLDTWFVKRGDGEAEWYSIPSVGTVELRFCVRVGNGQAMLTRGVTHSLGETLVPSAPIAFVEAGPSWLFGALEWHSRENPKGSEEEKDAMAAPISPYTTQRPCEEATVLICGERNVDFFTAARLATSESGKPPEFLCHCNFDHAVEHVVVCKLMDAVLVLTKDANGWRWVSVLDLHTARRLAESRVMIPFSQERDLRIHPLPVEGGDLHVYVAGRGGVLGHLVFSAVGDGVKSLSSRSGFFFAGPPCASTPSSFRAYRQLLPPPPAMKQEQGFLKRLMTLPWEEMALKMEERLQAGRPESFEDLRHRLALPAGCGDPPSPSPTPTTAPRQPAPAQEREGMCSRGRYAEIKSTAARENVSLNEARRIMNENQARLQDRGERISQIANRSRELAEEAAKFQDLARKLKEMQKNRWI